MQLGNLSRKYRAPYNVQLCMLTWTLGVHLVHRHPAVSNATHGHLALQNLCPNIDIRAMRRLELTANRNQRPTVCCWLPCQIHRRIMTAALLHASSSKFDGVTCTGEFPCFAVSGHCGSCSGTRPSSPGENVVAQRKPSQLVACGC